MYNSHVEPFVFRLWATLAAVPGLFVTADHYDTAITILKERFGDPQLLIFRHVEDLYILSPPSPNVTANLWQLNNTLHSHVRSLEMLSVQGSQYGFCLRPWCWGSCPWNVGWSGHAIVPESKVT